MSLRRIAPLLLAVVCVAWGCARRSTQESSASVGRSNAGRLLNPVRLPERGPDWIVPARWTERGALFGVQELVRGVQRAAASVRRQYPRARLGVADLSVAGGGGSRWHRSHESGRDVDLLFYTVDDRGRSLPPPDDMVAFDETGRPKPPAAGSYEDALWSERRFDPAANWALIEALLLDPAIRVQRIFVSDGLKVLLLDHARQHGRPMWLQRYAELILLQPGDSHPHDDHFHVRIYCPRSDRYRGCEDTGPVWHHEKKTHKYSGVERYDPIRWRLALGPIVRGVR